ncbi:MAG: ABC-2 type transporter [Candidatus Parvarchaeum acidophilus ARMAN-5]|uniref:ABC-2 type transporter n=1 Tax=Candidatus Parvarchaeum acidophilus ARMAN-5 TaxID=662762 RepID=D6GWD6_PARA5|nr:MAG: ABC-2 type transporter [Candidatus Parvarchaeum acidophilus ARMAN-5]
MIAKSIMDAFIVAKRDLIELYRTPLRLAMMFVFPILIIMLFGFMFPSTSSFNGVHIGIVNNDSGFTLNGQVTYLSSSFIPLIKYNSSISLVNYTSLNSAELALKDGTIDSVVYIPPNFSSSVIAGKPASITLVTNPTSPTLQEYTDEKVSFASSILSAEILNGTVAKLNSELVNLPKLDPQFIVSPLVVNSTPLIPGNYFDFIGPGLIMLLSMMAGLTALGSALSREKEEGTITAVMLSPIRTGSFLSGKMLSQLVRSLIQAGVVIILVILLFHMSFRGNILLTALILILGIFGFLGLGLLVTALTKDQETSQLLPNLVFSPMLFLSGVLYPSETILTIKPASGISCLFL